jgi:hypothetical protein
MRSWVPRALAPEKQRTLAKKILHRHADVRNGKHTLRRVIELTRVLALRHCFDAAGREKTDQKSDSIL